jgi:D-alanyl-lipoteichoic acid acyltransferase DltB (MBOAT superfamily)
VLFNSLIFVGFFLVVYSLYLASSRSVRTQNLLLLLASYVFYGYWDARFLGLIAASTIIDFFVGRRLQVTEDSARRKRLLAVSVCANLGMLGFFKYHDFFAASLASLLSQLGIQADPFTLGVILPVGISFYTFQTMSYTIDIYRGRLEPVNSFLDFALFVAFFPQLVAGPIERARHLLPQIQRARTLSAPVVNAGLFLLLWGYFKKVVIADRMAEIVNPVFGNHVEYQGLELLMAVLAFTVQIYCDFSGYSDIARGLARLMGFDLMVNFKLPYFAINPSDFWLRWHVSLSSWLRDYLYIPLGGNRGTTLRTQTNLTITMLLGGLWHGAAWNFVIWGAYHGGLLALYRWLDPRPVHADPWSGDRPRWVVGLMMATMMFWTVFGWLIFRADSPSQILYFLTHLGGGLGPTGGDALYRLSVFTIPLVAMQIWQYRTRDLLAATHLPTVPRWFLYCALFAAILIFGVRESSEFIYFQF